MDTSNETPFKVGDIVEDIRMKKGDDTKYGKITGFSFTLMFADWASTPEKLQEGTPDILGGSDTYNGHKYKLYKSKTNWRERLENGI